MQPFRGSIGSTAGGMSPLGNRPFSLDTPWETTGAKHPKCPSFERRPRKADLYNMVVVVAP